MVDRRDLVTFAQVKQLTGLPKWGLDRRIRALNIETFRDGHDLRVRLIKSADIERLTAPVPTRSDKPEPASAA